MMPMRLSASLIILVAGITALGACAAKTGPAKTSVTMELTGTILLVGNEPFPWLVLQSEDGRQYRFNEAEAKIYHDRQNQRVKIRAVVENQPMTLANGQKMPELWQLASIIELNPVP